MTTIGVEEEYLLLDPDTGLPVARGPEVREAAGLGRLAADREVQHELLQAQVEVATPVCDTLDEAGGTCCVCGRPSRWPPRNTAAGSRPVGHHPCGMVVPRP